MENGEFRVLRTAILLRSDVPLERAPHPFVRKRTFTLTGESHRSLQWVRAEPSINSQFSTLNFQLLYLEVLPLWAVAV